MADDQVAQVKQANDIVEVIGSYVTLRPAGPKFKGLCPFHDDHRPSFDVDPNYQNYRCWSCGKHGDVITFVQEHDKVDFREALEFLARRAGITLEKKTDSPQNRTRALMLEVVGWAAEKYQRCLLDSPLAEAARRYLGDRHLSGETVRRFGLGFAPGADWLSQHAAAAGIASQALVEVGLLAERDDGRGHYDRFRDRVMFPIRNLRGQTVGFGGRILPSSPSVDRGPKYYNSDATPLFNKSELLYGLDQARQAAAKAGYLAVVEGYTDVLMAHQHGVCNVVATMGTALNGKHVHNLRRIVPRVVLVFDADAGGNTGVDRALEIFVGQEVDLAIATLPEGLDPCDLLSHQGPEPFTAALEKAVNALEFKLDQVLVKAEGIEERRRAVDEVLNVIALAPEMTGQAGAIKRQLIVTRIAQRLTLKEENVWARLKELRARDRRRTCGSAEDEALEVRKAPAAPEERQLLQLLLADASLVALAVEEIPPEQIQHPGLRQLLQGLYDLYAQGAPPTLDQFRGRLENSELADAAFDLQEIGRHNTEREAWLRKIVTEFRRKRFLEPKQQEIKNQLHAADDHITALGLLRQLQNPN